MIDFPNISPEIFRFDFMGVSLSLRWYALAYIVGFYLCYLNMKLLLGRRKIWVHNTPPMDSNQLEGLVFYSALGTIIGGRIGYVVIYDPGSFIQDPLSTLRLWEGGMSFHGGFLGVILAVYLFCRRNGIIVLAVADMIAAVTPIGIFLGRLANFVNAELWGSPTTVPWGVIFPGDLAQSCATSETPCARHPTQLYEAALEGLALYLLILMIISLSGFKLRGLVTGLFIAGYGASRFFVEFFRIADAQFLTDQNPNGYIIKFGELGLKMGQLLSLPMVFIGVAIILTRKKKTIYVRR